MGMRSVMDIGGFCASGGPYVIENECPQGIASTMTVAPMVMIISMFMYIGFSGGGAGFILPWAAVFISLGYNFWTYALTPPVGEGIVWGWMMPAIMFFLMGGLPLLALKPIKYLSGLFQGASYDGRNIDAGNERWMVLIVHFVGVSAGIYGALQVFAYFTQF